MLGFLKPPSGLREVALEVGGVVRNGGNETVTTHECYLASRRIFALFSILTRAPRLVQVKCRPGWIVVKRVRLLRRVRASLARAWR